MKELKHLNKYFKKYWGKLLIGIIITIIARVFQLVMPSFVKKSIEVVENFVAGDLTEAAARNLFWSTS